MRQRTQVALLATLICATAGAQDVSVTSTTMAQMYQQNVPGFDKANLLPATEYLAIDANKLGSDRLSLHLYGWGYTDLQDQSTIGGKTAGNLTYGYLQYDFDQANAQIKAGRFTVNQGAGNEQVDGVSARTDLRNGFYVSAFAGTPVMYKNLSNAPQEEISFQRDFIFGARLAWRIPKIGELGVSYLEDGSSTANLDATNPVDYTRRQLGVDLKLSPCSAIDISGRTLFDVGNHDNVLPGNDTSSIAEHDYSATLKALANLSFTGTYVERNFSAYFTGTTLPNLFNMNEKGMFRATGLSGTWAPLGDLQIVADVKRTDRDLYGTATRAGADLRYNFSKAHVLVGAGYHKVNAFDVVQVDPTVPSYSLNHSEMRAWAMVESGKLSATIDAIRLHYSSPETNPSLFGKAFETQLVGSVGYQAATALKVSGDLSVEDTPLYQKQVMGLLKLEYRFGFSSKGGK